MAILYVGIDLAKNVFAVHGVDESRQERAGAPERATRQAAQLITSLAPCTVAMEACPGGHHWARLFMSHGHTVRLIAPKFVAPYRMSGVRGKNDAADAAAICEAVQRPAMRFVPVKSIDQQARLMVHRVRQGFVEARTACISRVRGLLSELGIVLPLKAATVRREAGAALKDLPGWANTVVGDLLSELHRLDERIAHCARHILAVAEALGNRAAFQQRLEACQVICVCPAHCHRHEWCHEPRETLRLASIPKRHARAALLRGFPGVRGFHRERTLSRAHDQTLVGNELDNFVCVGHAFAKEVSDKSRFGTHLHDRFGPPFDRFDIDIPGWRVVWIGRKRRDF